jgi:hypothetical protein
MARFFSLSCLPAKAKAGNGTGHVPHSHRRRRAVLRSGSGRTETPGQAGGGHAAKQPSTKRGLVPRPQAPGPTGPRPTAGQARPPGTGASRTGIPGVLRLQKATEDCSYQAGMRCHDEKTSDPPGSDVFSSGIGNPPRVASWNLQPAFSSNNALELLFMLSKKAKYFLRTHH